MVYCMLGRKINPNSNAQLSIKARNAGLTTFNGSPCIKCGCTERRVAKTSSPCINCDRERNRKAYASSSCDKLAASAKWAKNNREYLNAYKRAWYQMRKEG